MSKRTGSYESLIRGVSEQVPHDRYVGQMWAQENMVSDPVQGLARRQGSLMVTEKLRTDIALTAATKSDASTYKEFTFFYQGTEYAVFYRNAQIVAGSTMPALVVINKDTGVILDVVVGASDTAVPAALNGGLSAITNIAKYIVMAPNNRPPEYTTTDNVFNTRGTSCIWIKGGAYSRTYTATVVKTDGTRITRSYTTPTSYYPGTLNTSDIPATATDYQKQVNDRVYAYQTAVNQWIGTSAAAIQPQAIAQSLVDQFAGAGLAIGRIQSHIVLLDNNTMSVEGDDGGDGTLLKAVGQEVESANDLCPIALAGKVVRIRPRQGTKDGIYYVKAVAKDGNQDPTAGFRPVTWQECPGIVVQPGFYFLLAQVIGNTFYLASSPFALAAISGDVNQIGAVASSAGDLDSSPVPGFFGKRVDHLATFQDRLMIISGATVFMSRSADYFNWFRQSALSVLDDDPIEVYALGSEGDTITDSVKLDRSVILFGKQQQYALDGRQAITPKSAYVATQSAHEDATTCPPTASGNLIFFSQQRDGRLTVQQMQTGDYADSFRASEITTQLDGYLNGTPRQILALTSPSWLVIRTKENANGFWTYAYLDSADQTQRLYDSWSKWSFDSNLGQLAGVTGHNGNILALTVRQGQSGVYLVLDRFYRTARLSAYPYIDSIRPSTNTTGTIRTGWVGAANTFAVYDSTNDADLFLVGDTLANLASVVALGGGAGNVMLGTGYSSYLEPTSPYVRDQKDKAVLDCRLTLTSFKATFSKTAAVRAYIRGANQPASEQKEILDWIYRPAGAWVLNTQQVADTVTIPIHPMREIREFRLRIQARNWLPMTLSSMEWAGQFFTQRRS